MRIIYSVTLLLSLFGHSLIAQSTVTNASFPGLGDTLITATDNMPSISFDAAQTGEQSWDFTNLEAPFSSSAVFEDLSTATAADEFPNANAFTLTVGDVENYYQINDDKIYNLGYYGDDPLGLGFNAVVKFSPPLVERRAPVNFGDSFSSETNALIPFAAEDIPFGILDSLPISPDSFRIKINRVIEEDVDSFGSLSLEVGTFSVLKVKKIETVSVRLEAKVPFFNWQDITDLIGLSDILGETVIESHYFISDEAKEVLVDIRMNPDAPGELQAVSFKSGGNITNLDYLNWSRPSAYVYPNPVYFEAKFELMNIPDGEYTLDIYNIIGRKVIQVPVDIEGTSTIKLDITELRQGTYLYSLTNNRNKRLFTKKMTVIRP